MKIKIQKVVSITLSFFSISIVAGQSFCNSAQHSGTSENVTSNKVGSINGIEYELWAYSGNNNATFYSDGSFSCSFSSTKDCLCRSGLSFDSTKTHQQIGQIYADFKLVKQNISNVDYSYIGIYGWTKNPLVEFYVVDNWLSQYRPGDWVGNKKYGDFTIDGAQYTVYENTIDGYTQFKQYFSIRQQARDCGTIDITAHFEQWEKLGMTMGMIQEAKVLGEAGSNGEDTSGTVDFPYAKVYIANAQGGNSPAQSDPSAPSAAKTAAKNLPNTDTDKTIPNPTESIPVNEAVSPTDTYTRTCSSAIKMQGYPCCPSNCVVVYVDEYGTWGIINNRWCGCKGGGNNDYSCQSSIIKQGYKCCSRDNCKVILKDESGRWGVENKQWCGIHYDCK